MVFQRKLNTSDLSRDVAKVKNLKAENSANSKKSKK